jgi:hypothetical protein
MENFEPLERIDVNRVLSEAERLLVTGDLHGFENFVHALEATRQRYVEIERQSTVAVRQMEQEFAALRNELAYNPAALEQYRELQLSVDLHLSRLQAGRKEAEALAGILLKLRPELERFGGRRKAIELAVQARAVREELRQIKATFLPVLEQVVEKIFALNNAAATFNRTVSVAHLPQTQFLQCRVDLTQLLAALAELDVVVTPEMETLAASAPVEKTLTENGPYDLQWLNLRQPSTENRDSFTVWLSSTRAIPAPTDCHSAEGEKIISAVLGRAPLDRSRPTLP